MSAAASAPGTKPRRVAEVHECEYCWAPFHPLRTSARRFCSVSCSWAAQRKASAARATTHRVHRSGAITDTELARRITNECLAAHEAAKGAVT